MEIWLKNNFEINSSRNIQDHLYAYSEFLYKHYSVKWKIYF